MWGETGRVNARYASASAAVAATGTAVGGDGCQSCSNDCLPKIGQIIKKRSDLHGGGLGVVELMDDGLRKRRCLSVLDTYARRNVEISLYIHARIPCCRRGDAAEWAKQQWSYYNGRYNCRL